jgi:hypothetical protein
VLEAVYSQSVDGYDGLVAAAHGRSSVVAAIPRRMNRTAKGAGRSGGYATAADGRHYSFGEVGRRTRPVEAGGRCMPLAVAGRCRDLCRRHSCWAVRSGHQAVVAEKGGREEVCRSRGGVHSCWGAGARRLAVEPSLRQPGRCQWELEVVYIQGTRRVWWGVLGLVTADLLRLGMGGERIRIVALVVCHCARSGRDMGGL